MLLPSDVARLVLGYLQEEGLTATSQAFIHESPNLKEYAEHTTGDGTIPGCVFSIFGKGLTTILNEYVAAKTKESSHEVPAMMTSLWKKLDFTLNQIKSLQNSPAISAFQRTRSRVGVANMARQRVLAVASAGGVICSSVSETSPIISPAHSSHSMLGHSTPVCYSGLNTRLSPGSGTHQHIQDSSRLLNMARDSPVQIIVSEHRLNPGPMSPGRRKWDTPRKRSGALSGSSGPGRSAMTASSISAEPQPEEVVDENFPQLVIQNARDKILGDRSLQEKLAENINKILANEPIPQTSKASSSTVETDQSIDEILGLQGEIHMSDDAIHDILEQTESDPAFQALFDLFDYNKTRFTDGEAGDGDTSCSPEETDSAGSSSTVRPHQNVDTGASHSDSSASDITPTTVKLKTAQDRKTRKSTAPALLKKTVLGPSGRPSRIENSSARLIVSQGDSQGVLSAPVDSSRKEKGSLFTTSANETPMDIDEPLNTPPPPLESLATQEPPTKDSTSITPIFGESSTDPSSSDSGAFAAPEETSASTVDNKKKHQQSPESKEQPATATSSSLSLVQIQLNNTPTPNLDLPHTLASSSGGDTLPVSTFSVTSESVSKTFSSAGATVPAASPSSASVATPFTGRPATPTPASTSAAPTAVSASATPVSPASSSSSCTPVAPLPVASVAATADPVTTSNPSQAAADSSNVMSLKIIISENQDEGSSSDTALNQAISNISGDKMPTIYLSSPTKSDVCPGTPKVNLDEAAQAVTGLQRSEVYASPLSSKAGGVNASPLTRTSQAQQSYIILDTTNPSLQGAPASYFIVTEPPTSNTEGRQVLLPAGVSKGPPLPTNQYAVTTPTRSPGYSTGSALILPSPVKSVVLPVSVVGPNTLGKVQMVSNQFVALPTPVPVEQTENVKPKTLTATASHSASAGTEKNLGSKVVQPVSAENTGQQDASKGPNHRRILCFDSSAEVQPQPAKTNKTSIPVIPDTSTSQSVQQIEKTEMASVVRTRPAILGGNKPKRRVQTVRCLGDPQAGVSFSLQQHQKDPVKKNSRKQDHKIHNQESQSASTSSVAASTIEAGKTSESEKRSKSVERKYNLDVHKDETKAQDSDQSRSLSSDPAPKSGSKKDKEESTRKESAEKAPLKPREGRAEKRAPSQEIPNVTANKENEIKGAMQEQQQSAPSSSVSRDLSPSAVSQTSSQSQSRSTKTPSKTSSLAKQAAEMLNDIQGIHSPSTPIKGSGAGSADLNLSGTSSKHTAPADGSRTPVRQKGKCKDGEGTPKHLMPSNTPDLPSCSPASEAGSENSINMAAHTLMILSRAAIARTGSPLKDSLRQEGVGEKSTTSSKNSKKRKQTFSASTPPAKKDSKRSPSKKKDQERKKFIDCFPHDLDVDKFLSSLHYDE